MQVHLFLMLKHSGVHRVSICERFVHLQNANMHGGFHETTFCKLNITTAKKKIC